MQKGQIGKILIFLLIVGIIAYFAWPYIQNLFLRACKADVDCPSGYRCEEGKCIAIPPPPKCKNDVITVEDYSAYPSKPYANSTTTIEFWIKNNGDEEVKEIEVNFFDVPGFEVTEINCDGNIIKKQKKCDSTDFVMPIDPFDIRMIVLSLKAPDVTSPTPFTISYYIRYNYSGYRKADIPIIDGITRRVPLSSFSQSDPTCGPVLLEFESKVGRERKEDDRIIREYWSRMDEPFEVKMNFKHVGSSAIGIIKPINITKGKVRLDLNNSLVKKEPCNFEEKDSYLSSKKDVLVPSTLICNFVNSSYFKEPESLAVIHAEFNYTYEYIRTETFTVQPIPEE